MKRKGITTYLAIFITFLAGVAMFWNLVLSAFIIVNPDKVPFVRVEKLKYGAAKLSGRVMNPKYGQVDFSRVSLLTDSGQVTVLFGLFSRIEDPQKKRYRDTLPLSRMSRKSAIRELNKPLTYDNIEAIGIYYPFASAMYAYYLNGQITAMEFAIVVANFLLATAFLATSVTILVSIFK